MFSIDKLDKCEDILIDEFGQHSLLQNISKVKDNDFLDILVQRRFLSLAFTPIYDVAIDWLEDEDVRRIARRILREEYPGRDKRPSHREDLIYDLLLLGLTKEQILKARPSQQTQEILLNTMNLFYADDPNSHLFQIRVITILRFWGEALVAAEYGQLWKRMEEMGLTIDGKNASEFYYPHYNHDRKSKPLTQLSMRDSTHSDLLSKHLVKRLNTPECIDHCIEVEKQIVQIKLSFYDQFLHMASTG